ASPTLSSCVVRSNSSYGIYTYANNGASANTNVTNCTIHSNGTYGVYVSANVGASETVNLKNSNVTQQSYGVYRIVGNGATTANVTYSNIWGNTTSNYTNVVGGTGCLSSNPLYVTPPTNLRLTSNSPSRFAGDVGGDLGPLPYTVDATPGLYGTL